MNPFDVAAVLIAVAAVAGYVNHRVLKLPAASGTLVVALLSSFAVVATEALVPSLRTSIATFLGEIDFNQTLMHGMLCFLLFAGALHVDLAGLINNKWTIGVLSTVGVLLSTAVIGGLTWGMFALIGARVPYVACFILGAIISPTDPIAVMGLLKELKAARGADSSAVARGGHGEALHLGCPAGNFVSAPGHGRGEVVTDVLSPSRQVADRGAETRAGLVVLRRCALAQALRGRPHPPAKL